MADRVTPNPIAYQRRMVLDLGIARNEWCAKIYAILGTGRLPSDLPPQPILAQTLNGAMTRMQGPRDHPCGFAIFHLADDGFYLLLSRFNDANNLAHRVCAIDRRDATLSLRPLKDERIVACVWELSLMHSEARFWVDCVLRNGLTKATEEAYLRSRVTGYI